MGSRIGSEFLRAKRLHRGRLCLEPDPGSRCRLRIATSPCAGGQTAGPFTFVAVVLQGLDVILSTKSR